MLGCLVNSKRRIIQKKSLPILSEEIRERYIADYIQTWQDALNNLEIIHFVDLRHAVDVLDALTSNEKPLQKMINLIDKNSDIYPSLSGINAENRNENTNVSNSKSNGIMQIAQHFAPLVNEVKAASDAGQPHMDTVMKKLSELKILICRQFRNHRNHLKLH